MIHQLITENLNKAMCTVRSHASAEPEPGCTFRFFTHSGRCVANAEWLLLAGNSL